MTAISVKGSPANTEATLQQRALETMAAELLHKLDDLVPSNVAHYAVEDLRAALRRYLAPGTPAVTTHDVQGSREPMPVKITQTPEQALQADLQSGSSIDEQLAEMDREEQVVLGTVRRIGYCYSDKHTNADRYMAIHRLMARGVLVYGPKGYGQVVFAEGQS